MNELTRALTENLIPRLAVIVYRADTNGYYLESHDINEKGQLMAGKPLEQSSIQEIVDVFFDERMNKVNIGGLIPANMLYYQHNPGGNYDMVWYRPAEKRVLHHAVQLKIATAPAWVPAMIYRVHRNDLYVYALKTDNRPTEKTRLCYAPFFNVADDGDVCLGNAKIKKPKEKTYENMMKYWEDLFWLSEFSHVNGKEKVRSKNLAAVWRSLITSKGRKKWSDIEELIQTKQTVKDIL